MALHNPTSSPLVYDQAGHQVDGHGVITNPDLTDELTASLVDAGILTEIPSPAADTENRDKRRSDRKDS